MFMQGPSDQLFTGAGLAGNQHCHTRTRQAPDRSEYLLHSRSLADHSGNRCQRRRILADRPTCDAGRPPNQRDSLIHIERFGQVFKGTSLVCRNSTVQIRMRRHNDYRHFGIVRLKTLHHFQTIHPRHADVGNKYVRFLTGECLQQRIRCFKTLRADSIGL
jgi:hypothetical protein